MIENEPGTASPDDTNEAMRDGMDIIVQAPLESAHWRGRADVLLKIAFPSDLGEWSYEVVM